jgi:restriction endonuclease S subunit
VRQQVESPIRTTSGVHNINTKELLALQFPLPARDAQDEALAVLGRLFRLLDDLEAKLRKQEQTATRLAESLAAAVAA